MVKPPCPDCGADMQLVSAGWRCPWTTPTRHRLVGGSLACNWPRGKPRMDLSRPAWSEAAHDR